MLKKKLPWLAARLREQDKTPTDLARELGVGSPRVFEMIAGRRAMQLDEVVPTACYLKMPVYTVAKQVMSEKEMLFMLAVGYEAATERAWWAP